jgi:hypothetical protein
MNFQSLNLNLNRRKIEKQFSIPSDHCVETGTWPSVGVACPWPSQMGMASEGVLTGDEVYSGGFPNPQLSRPATRTRPTSVVAVGDGEVKKASDSV